MRQYVCMDCDYDFDVNASYCPICESLDIVDFGPEHDVGESCEWDNLSFEGDFPSSKSESDL